MSDSARLHLFPTDRIVRPPRTGGRSEAVAVTHLGLTHVYDCPQDMHAAVLVACRAELAAAERAHARRRLATYKARLRARRRNRSSDAILFALLALMAVAAVLLPGWGA